MCSYRCGYRLFPWLRLAAITLVATALGTLASCGGNRSCPGSVLCNASTSSSPVAKEIKAQTVVVISNGRELRIGTTKLSEDGSGNFGVGEPPTDTVYVFRDLNGVGPDVALSFQKAGVIAGKAYVRTNAGLIFVKDVDLRLTDHQIAMQFGIQFPSMPDDARDAILDGNLGTVKLLLKDNPKLVSSTDAGGNAPLHLAVWHGHEAIVEFLLANGADVNGKGNQGDTPLHGVAQSDYMAERDRKAVAELLLAKGADVNARNNRGQTPLGAAVDKGHNRHEDIVTLLRQHGGHE